VLVAERVNMTGMQQRRLIEQRFIRPAPDARRVRRCVWWPGIYRGYLAAG